ncbi:MAG TPA: hypothetical protein VN836_10200 [Verrucomicrobiae bacterium]|nr:hypothetical protein [Verrucomicrobiae bacterium]
MPFGTAGTGMLIPIKIICPCGQKYAFDVSPVDGRMPAPIQCPRCGADGTAVANAIISLALGGRSASNLPAQQKAEHLVATRDALAPMLAQAVKEAVVQELAAQRRELLRVQEIAAMELVALVRRLDSLQAPLQDRMRAYEARIQELEKELAARAEENHELLKLKIEMLRCQLETERVHNRMEFN